MSATYEHRGGTAAHNPDFDHGDDITQLEDDTLGMLEDAQALHEQLHVAKESLAAKIREALAILLPVGTKLSRREWSYSVAGGNPRGALTFEIAAEPSSISLDLTRPNLSKCLIQAWPLNEAGKRMSGRVAKSYSGSMHRDTVTLSIYLGTDKGPDDMRSSTDIFMDTIRRAALAKG